MKKIKLEKKLHRQRERMKKINNQKKVNTKIILKMTGAFWAPIFLDKKRNYYLITVRL